MQKNSYYANMNEAKIWPWPIMNFFLIHFQRDALNEQIMGCVVQEGKVIKQM